MSILAILTLIGVAASIVNALKSNNKTRQNSFDKEIRTVIRSTGEHYKRMAQSFSASNNKESKRNKSNRDEMLNRVSGLYSSSHQNPTDFLEDFGDLNEAELPMSQQVQLLDNGPASFRSPDKTSNRLDLKPSPKKLAEAFILAECFNEPRAKRPYQARKYIRK